MAEWFIKRDDESGDVGPLRPAELLNLVRDGQVTRETMLRKDDSSYFHASEVGGLFEAAMRPTIEHFCPGCQHAIEEPPTKCNHCGREIRKAITKITENSIVHPGTQSIAKQAGDSVRNWLRKKRISKDESEN